jgi:hypothetical protein
LLNIQSCSYDLGKNLAEKHRGIIRDLQEAVQDKIDEKRALGESSDEESSETEEPASPELAPAMSPQSCELAGLLHPEKV